MAIVSGDVELPIIVRVEDLPQCPKGRIGLVSPEANGAVTTGLVKSMECSVAQVHFKASSMAYDEFVPRQYSMHFGAEKWLA